MHSVETHTLTKVYGTGEAAVTALDQLSLQIEAGSFVAVMGPSGCGKSTLLQLLGALDRPTAGAIVLAGTELSRLGDDEVTIVRRRKIGFIFQSFNLLPVLNAIENVALPLTLDGVRPRDAQSRATAWLRRLGLGDRLEHRPDQLSGGQQQRVAIARALVSEPVLILADEPTGNLDSATADDIAALLRASSATWGRTVVMVTHDQRIAAVADRIIMMKDGRIIGDSRTLPRQTAPELPAAAMEAVR
jgi:putative ABC transport system ATP-binding protein